MQQQPVSSQRYLALDVLRGMTVALMILVNNPGSWSHIYAPLKHAAWQGCTPTDLVFPFFLFVVGTSMYFSFSKYGNKLNRDTLLKIGKRTLLIFAIGLFLNSFPQWSADFSKLRIMGVLQRIALAYGISAILVLSVNRKYLPWLGGAILLAYWGLVVLIGGSDPYSLAGNPASPVDTAILGVNHIYKGFGIPFDPEGIFSTIPAVVTVLIGYLAGALIKETPKIKVPVFLLSAGILAVAGGWTWGLYFPISKPIWSGSYVLYTAGMAAILMSLLIWLIDVKGHSGWTSFFVVFGVNPLFIFAFSGLWARILGRMIHVTSADGTVVSGSAWLYKEVFVPFAGEMNGSLLYAIAHVILFWLLGYILLRKKIFIKV
ncbi:MAG TPA: heparan-alpha-glucosaminide N-acetyltransferase domain-containing protein [Prolixibacteraceae bacterium]|nr:heparan-alpha-glucosaminide N-acetyltransferase domain-containing protein [Prolixibacteraceae bacterium]